MFKNKYKLRVKQANEPSDIIWENLEVSHCKRVQRRILAVLITIAIMLASITIVYTLKTYTSTVPNNNSCKELNILGNLALSEAKSLYSNKTEIFCYCKQQSLYEFVSNTDVSYFCEDYLSQESIIALSKFMGSAGVIIINLILKVILTKLSAFERTSTETKQKLQTMTRVFIALFINTSILTLLANTNLQNLGVVHYLPYNQYILNGNYNDFSRE